MKNATQQLIQTLGKNEKRFFRMFAEQGKKKGNHQLLLLYDRLAKLAPGQPLETLETDSGMLKTDLPSALYKLNRLIMKSLRIYHSGKTENSKMRAAMEEVELLFQKGLFNACQRKIRKLRSQAMEKEYFQVLLELSDWDFQLIRAHPPQNPIPKIKELHQQKLELIAKIKEHEDSLSRYRMALLIYNLRPTQAGAHQELLDELIVMPEELPLLTSVGRLSQWILPGLKAMEESQFTLAQICFEEAVALFRKRPFLINKHPEIYRVSLANLLNANLFLNDKERYVRLLDDLPKIRMESRTDKRRLQILLYYSDLLYCMNFGQQARGSRLVAEIQSWIKRNHQDLETDILFNFYYNSCLFHFMYGHYPEALSQINLVLSSKRKDLRQDIFDFAHIFQLVIHWELGHFDLLEYQIKNVRRYLKTRNLDREYENRVVATFHQLLSDPSPSQVHSQLQALYDFLQGLDLEPQLTTPLGFQELLMWTESKLSNQDIGALYRQRLAQR